MGTAGKKNKVVQRIYVLWGLGGGTQHDVVRCSERSAALAVSAVSLGRTRPAGSAVCRASMEVGGRRVQVPGSRAFGVFVGSGGARVLCPGEGEAGAALQDSGGGCKFVTVEPSKLKTERKLCLRVGFSWVWGNRVALSSLPQELWSQPRGPGVRWLKRTRCLHSRSFGSGTRASQTHQLTWCGDVTAASPGEGPGLQPAASPGTVQLASSAA